MLVSYSNFLLTSISVYWLSREVSLTNLIKRLFCSLEIIRLAIGQMGITVKNLFLFEQYYSGTHYLGVWGAKIRQQVLKYTLTDCFTLTLQMRLLKASWTFSDRDLLLYSIGKLEECLNKELTLSSNKIN